MVGEAIKQGTGEPFRLEHLGPLVEGQFGGHRDKAALVALAEDLSERESKAVPDLLEDLPCLPYG